MKKSHVRIVLSILVICIFAFFINIGIGFYFGNKVCDFRTQVLFALQDNVLNLHCIPYEYLDDKYKQKISMEQYDAADSPKEILEIYNIFNSILYELKPTTEITTDGWKTYPIGIVEVDGKTYKLEHHIDFKVSGLKPRVVKWCVEIREHNNK